MNTIVLHVYYACKPGMAERFVKSLKEKGLQETVRREEGCLRYDYHLSWEEPDTVVLLEQWRDAAALDRHLAQPHMAEIGRVKDEFVLNTKVERYE